MRKLVRTGQSRDNLVYSSEIKAFIRQDFDFEDSYLNLLQETAVGVLEKELRIPLVSGDYSIICDLTDEVDYDYARCRPAMSLGKYNLDEIYEICTYDNLGEVTLLEPDVDYNYVPTLNSIYFPTKKNVRSIERDILEVKISAGWDRGTVPNSIKVAILNICAHFSENRSMNVDIPKEAFQPCLDYKFWL